MHDVQIYASLSWRALLVIMLECVANTGET